MNASQRNDCAEVTELLLEAGADIKATDAKGRSALAHALKGGLKRILEVLGRCGATE
jgi:ankyrin repeat protein